MKKILLITVLGFIVSCSKNDNTAPANTTPEGKWVGVYTNFIGPSRYFALTFNASGSIIVEANAVLDIANGTWSLVADSVRATYTFAGTNATYSLAGKYSTSSNTMDGTIGLESNTTGKAVFSVTKQ